MKFREYLLKEEWFGGEDKKVDRRQRFGRYEDRVASIRIFKNPAERDVLDVIKKFKEDNPEQYEKIGMGDAVRGFFDMKDNLYVWYGSFFHDNVETYLRAQKGTETLSMNERLRFSWFVGDDYLTVERDAGFLRKSKEEKKKIRVDRITKAFPVTDGKGGFDIKRGNKGWVTADKRSTPPDTEDSENGSDETDITKSTAKKSTFKKPVNEKELGKIGDILNFTDGSSAKILAVAKMISPFNRAVRYHYIFTARKTEDGSTYTAERLLGNIDGLTWIDGKHNITKANEPFVSNTVDGDRIKKIIPDPERIKNKPNNLYTPKHKQEPFNAYDENDKTTIKIKDYLN